MADKSILHMLPGYEQALENAGTALGPTYYTGATQVSLEPLAMFIIALAVLFTMVMVARKSFLGKDAIIPDESLTLRTFFELFLDTVVGLMADIMGGEKNARRFLPLIGSCAVVIFFSNFLGLMPGMLPPTESLNINAAMALIIFAATHVVGVQTNGLGHFAHMANPVGTWWGWILAPLMFPIELIGHIVRPVSLSLRLMGNMIGDHAVLSIFLGLVPLVVPIPFLVLGSVVCSVQTAVFCLLSMVYIGMALEEHHHGDEEGAH